MSQPRIPEEQDRAPPKPTATSEPSTPPTTDHVDNALSNPTPNAPSQTTGPPASPTSLPMTEDKCKCKATANHAPFPRSPPYTSHANTTTSEKTRGVFQVHTPSFPPPSRPTRPTRREIFTRCPHGAFVRVPTPRSADESAGPSSQPSRAPAPELHDQSLADAMVRTIGAENRLRNLSVRIYEDTMRWHVEVLRELCYQVGDAFGSREMYGATDGLLFAADGILEALDGIYESLEAGFHDH